VIRSILLGAVLALLAPAVAHADTDHPINDPATGFMVATRLDPPPPPAPVLFTTDALAGRCVGAEFLLGYFSPGWNVERMSRIMYRESRCSPTADNRSSSATGLLQILSSHCPWLARQMGEPCSASRLTDPAYNIRAAAALWLEQGYSAWATS